MELLLKRPYPGVPWGFRIIGGSDSHLPIIVSKVLENSVAEKSGLEEDVLLERINNIPTSGLTHSEVNQIILSADTELLFTIRRENLENLILASLNEEDNNSEITNILREAVSKGTIIEEDENLISTEKEDVKLKREFGVTMIIDNNNNIREENETLNKNQPKLYTSEQTPKTGKQWSTFLQKPKNPTPRPKNQAPPIPKANQYRVVIKKQTKTEIPEARLQTKSVLSKENTEHPTLESEPENNMSKEMSFSLQDVEIMPVEDQETNEYQENGIIDDIQIIQNNSSLEDDHQEDYIEENNQEHYDESDLDIVKENITTENGPSLEEQLAAVQKQLQELAQLPSAIQETLSVVTQQLASIVGEHKPQTDESSSYDGPKEDDEEAINTYDGAEKDDEHFDQSENVEELVDESSETLEMDGIQSSALSDIGEEQELSEVIEEEVNFEPTSEELEEQRIQKEKIAKQQLVEEWNSKWPWSDSSKKVYKINFLKYTPPPKNLDYLQRSEVYRLVHGMEPPVKGISIRSEKLLAEQDYHTAGGN